MYVVEFITPDLAIIPAARRGHWGLLETEIPHKKKNTQNRKTAINFDQNRKPHSKPSKPKIYTPSLTKNNTQTAVMNITEKRIVRKK